MARCVNCPFKNVWGKNRYSIEIAWGEVKIACNKVKYHGS